MNTPADALEPTLPLDDEGSESGVLHFDGRYRVRQDLGKGGFGRVMLVADELCDGELRALKVVLDEHQADPSFERRFRNEIRILRTLHHPGIPQIFNDGRTPDGELYYTMDYIEGVTLESILHSEGPLSSARTVRLLQQMLAILEYAHAHGVVHRDLKPNNIMIVGPGAEDERVVLLDFGIAKLLTGDAKESLATIAAMGTPHYMAPEQVEGSEIDERCDLYGLGVILYRMISNRLPFGGATPMGIAVARLHEDPTPLENNTLSAPFRSLVGGLLARQRQERPSMEEIRLHLAGIASRPQTPVSRLTLGALSICSACLALMMFWPARAEGPSAPRPRAAPSVPVSPDLSALSGIELESRVETNSAERAVQAPVSPPQASLESARAPGNATDPGQAQASESVPLAERGSESLVPPAGEEEGSGEPGSSLPPGQLQVTLDPDRYYVVLDGSGSMHSRIAGEEKLAIAVQVLSSVFDRLAPPTEVAVRLFGHSRSSAEPGADHDTELVAPFEPVRPARLRATLTALRPRGQSPVGLALRQTEADLASLAGQPVAVILLAEGGQRISPPDRSLDPVLEARALSEIPGVRFHVVGFTDDPKESESLGDIAREAQGRFWPAADAQALRRCIEQLVAPLPAEYRLLGPGDSVRGFPIGSPLSLPAGDYTLESTRGEEAFRYEIRILPGDIASIAFGAGGFHRH